MQIRIRQYVFTLSEPFRAGTVLTAGEAQALNGLRAENIRNNIASAVLQEISALPDGEMLSAATLLALQLTIDRYSENYQFLLRHTPRPRAGLIEAEASSLAREQVLARRRADGEVLEGPAVEVEVELLADTSTVQDEARRRVAARQAVASQALADL